VKVSSPVGEFPFELTSLSVRGGHVRLEGAMGAWPAHVEIGPGDALSLVRLLPRPALVAGGAVAAALAIKTLSRRD
jgi:hypothetical protein